MPFVFHGFQICVRVPLMSSTELVVPDKPVSGIFLPFGSAYVVLSVGE